MKASFRSFEDLTSAVSKRLNEIAKKASEVNGRKIEIKVKEGAQYPNGVLVEKVAQFVEFGTWEKKDGEERRVAPRPFLRTAIYNNKEKWEAEIKNKVIKVLHGEGSNYKQAMASVAKNIVKDVQSEIKGFGAVRTGRLLNSIEAEVI